MLWCCLYISESCCKIHSSKLSRGTGMTLFLKWCFISSGLSRPNFFNQVEEYWSPSPFLTVKLWQIFVQFWIFGVWQCARMVFRWVVYMVTDVQIFDAWICDRKIVFRMGENCSYVSSQTTCRRSDWCLNSWDPQSLEEKELSCPSVGTCQFAFAKIAK